nr:MAG TPA: hypothetical protein [Caudoviricetes sp.]
MRWIDIVAYSCCQSPLARVHFAWRQCNLQVRIR